MGHCGISKNSFWSIIYGCRSARSTIPLPQKVGCSFRAAQDRPACPDMRLHLRPLGVRQSKSASRSLITVKPRMRILIPTGSIRVRALGKSAWIEITEAALIDDDKSVVRLLRQSRLPGVQIALYAISSERNITTTAEGVETKEQCENCSGSAAPRCRVSCSVAQTCRRCQGING